MVGVRSGSRAVGRMSLPLTAARRLECSVHNLNERVVSMEELIDLKGRYYTLYTGNSIA